MKLLIWLLVRLCGWEYELAVRGPSTSAWSVRTGADPRYVSSSSFTNETVSS